MEIHMHHHGDIDDYLDEPLPTALDNVTRIFDIDITDEEIDLALDMQWKTRESATSALFVLHCTRAMKIVRQNIPEAVTVVLREDTSHLPPHGHVDDILDADGNTLMPHHDDWHDSEWTHEVDEEVWDIYYLSSIRFAHESDGVRRIRITV